MSERRRETRHEVAASAALTPLESVTENLQGCFLNVSTHGIRVRIDGATPQEPRIGDLYRISGASDRMLCRVTHSRPSQDGTEIGFRVVYWNVPGELNQLVADRMPAAAHSSVLRDLRIPALM